MSDDLDFLDFAPDDDDAPAPAPPADPAPAAPVFTISQRVGSRSYLCEPVACAGVYRLHTLDGRKSEPVRCTLASDLALVAHTAWIVDGAPHDGEPGDTLHPAE